MIKPRLCWLVLVLAVSVCHGTYYCYQEWRTFLDTEKIPSLDASCSGIRKENPRSLKHDTWFIGGYFMLFGECPSKDDLRIYEQVVIALDSDPDEQRIIFKRIFSEKYWFTPRRFRRVLNVFGMPEEQIIIAFEETLLETGNFLKLPGGMSVGVASRLTQDTPFASFFNAKEKRFMDMQAGLSVYIELINQNVRGWNGDKEAANYKALHEYARELNCNKDRLLQRHKTTVERFQIKDAETFKKLFLALALYDLDDPVDTFRFFITYGIRLDYYLDEYDRPSHKFNFGTGTFGEIFGDALFQHLGRMNSLLGVARELNGINFRVALEAAGGSLDSISLVYLLGAIIRNERATYETSATMMKELASMESFKLLKADEDCSYKDEILRFGTEDVIEEYLKATSSQSFSAPLPSWSLRMLLRLMIQIPGVESYAVQLGIARALSPEFGTYILAELYFSNAAYDRGIKAAQRFLGSPEVEEYYGKSYVLETLESKVEETRKQLSDQQARMGPGDFFNLQKQIQLREHHLRKAKAYKVLSELMRAKKMYMEGQAWEARELIEEAYWQLVDRYNDKGAEKKVTYPNETEAFNGELETEVEGEHARKKLIRTNIRNFHLIAGQSKMIGRREINHNPAVLIDQLIKRQSIFYDSMDRLLRGYEPISEELETDYVIDMARNLKNNGAALMKVLSGLFTQITGRAVSEEEYDPRYRGWSEDVGEYYIAESQPWNISALTTSDWGYASEESEEENTEGGQTKVDAEESPLPKERDKITKNMQRVEKILTKHLVSVKAFAAFPKQTTGVKGKGGTEGDVGLAGLEGVLQTSAELVQKLRDRLLRDDWRKAPDWADTLSKILDLLVPSENSAGAVFTRTFEIYSKLETSGEGYNIWTLPERLGGLVGVLEAIDQALDARFSGIKAVGSLLSTSIEGKSQLDPEKLKETMEWLCKSQILCVEDLINELKAFYDAYFPSRKAIDWNALLSEHKLTGIIRRIKPVAIEYRGIIEEAKGRMLEKAEMRRSDWKRRLKERLSGICKEDGCLPELIKWTKNRHKSLVGEAVSVETVYAQQGGLVWMIRENDRMLDEAKKEAERFKEEWSLILNNTAALFLTAEERNSEAWLDIFQKRLPFFCHGDGCFEDLLGRAKEVNKYLVPGASNVLGVLQGVGAEMSKLCSEGKCKDLYGYIEQLYRSTVKPSGPFDWQNYLQTNGVKKVVETSVEAMKIAYESRVENGERAKEAFAQLNKFLRVIRSPFLKTEEIDRPGWEGLLADRAKELCEGDGCLFEFNEWSKGIWEKKLTSTTREGWPEESLPATLYDRVKRSYDRERGRLQQVSNYFLSKEQAGSDEYWKSLLLALGSFCQRYGCIRDLGKRIERVFQSVAEVFPSLRETERQPPPEVRKLEKPILDQWELIEDKVKLLLENFKRKEGLEKTNLELSTALSERNEQAVSLQREKERADGKVLTLTSTLDRVYKYFLAEEERSLKDEEKDGKLLHSLALLCSTPERCFESLDSAVVTISQNLLSPPEGVSWDELKRSSSLLGLLQRSKLAAQGVAEYKKIELLQDRLKRGDEAIARIKSMAMKLEAELKEKNLAFVEKQEEYRRDMAKAESERRQIDEELKTMPERGEKIRKLQEEVRLLQATLLDQQKEIAVNEQQAREEKERLEHLKDLIQRKIEETRRQKQELSAQSERLEEELESARAGLVKQERELSEAMDSKRRQLAEVESKTREKERAVLEQREEVESLRLELARVENEAEVLREQHKLGKEELQNQLMAKEEERKVLYSQREKLSEGEKKLVALKNEVEELERKNQFAEEQQKQERSRLEEAKIRLEQRDNEHESAAQILRKELAEHQSQLESIERRIKDTTGSIEERRGEFSEKQRELEQSLVRLSEESRRLEEDFKSAEGELTRKKQELSRATEEREQRLREVDSKVEEKKQLIKEQEQAIGLLNLELLKTTEAIRELKKQHEMGSSELALRLQSEQKELQRLHEEDRSLGEDSQKLAKLKSQVKKLREKVELQKSQQESERNSLAESKQKFEEDKRRLDSILRELQQEVSKHKDEHQRLLKEIKQREESLEEQQKEIRAEKSRLEAEEQDLEDAGVKLNEALKKQREEGAERLHELRSTLVALREKVKETEQKVLLRSQKLQKSVGDEENVLRRLKILEMSSDQQLETLRKELANKEQVLESLRAKLLVRSLKNAQSLLRMEQIQTELAKLSVGTKVDGFLPDTSELKPIIDEQAEGLGLPRSKRTIGRVIKIMSDQLKQTRLQSWPLKERIYDLRLRSLVDFRGSAASLVDHDNYGEVFKDAAQLEMVRKQIKVQPSEDVIEKLDRTMSNLTELQKSTATEEQVRAVRVMEEMLGLEHSLVELQGHFGRLRDSGNGSNLIEILVGLERHRKRGFQVSSMKPTISSEKPPLQETTKPTEMQKELASTLVLSQRFARTLKSIEATVKQQEEQTKYSAINFKLAHELTDALAALGSLEDENANLREHLATLRSATERGALQLLNRQLQRMTEENKSMLKKALLFESRYVELSEDLRATLGVASLNEARLEFFYMSEAVRRFPTDIEQDMALSKRIQAILTELDRLNKQCPTMTSEVPPRIFRPWIHPHPENTPVLVAAAQARAKRKNKPSCSALISLWRARLHEKAEEAPRECIRDIGPEEISELSEEELAWVPVDLLSPEQLLAIPPAKLQYLWWSSLTSSEHELCRVFRDFTQAQLAPLESNKTSCLAVQHACRVSQLVC